MDDILASIERFCQRTLDVPPGRPFWYENANGLVEIAVNLGRADADLALEVGTGLTVALESR